MYEFRFLLDRFWVTRAENKDLYFAVKRALPHYRRLVNEQLGWNLIVNEAVVKLEKVPAKAMAWMGIQEFQEKLDYCLLCALLLFLSDLDDGEQFLLSSLTEGIEALLAEVQPVDWTRFPHRKSLVRVLQYAQRTGMLLVYDGASEGFGSDQTQEVLYENTGLSRHFPTHFGRDTLHCASIEDYEAFLWEGEEADRGRQRIQRVYRQLALAPALYWSRQNRSDYEYVKNQRSWLNHHLGEAMGGELQIHRNGAFFVLDEESRFGLVHPREAAIPEAALLAAAGTGCGGCLPPPGGRYGFPNPAGIPAGACPMPPALRSGMGPPPAGASPGKAGTGAGCLHGRLDAFGGAGRGLFALSRCWKMDRALSRRLSGRARRGEVG